jgi:hypothetical protein
MGVEPVPRRGLEHHGGLVGGERLRWPALLAGRRGDEQATLRLTKSFASACRIARSSAL